MDDNASSSRLLRTRPPPGGPAAWDDDRIEVIGRYTLHARLGNGGMAAVHLGWVTGAADFSRVVAIKRLHPQFALDEQFVARFRDEAWLCSRLSHPNVVQVLDVVEWSQELLIVMEYVHGVSVAAILVDAGAAARRLPPAVVAGILVPALHGLHAAHETTDDEGHPIGIVHRDFSPQNIMVSADGHAKVLDFGIAKARTQAHVTSTGQVSGKCGYFAPEQAMAGPMDRRTDVFAAGIVLWEMLAGRRLFFTPGHSEVAAIHQVLHHPVEPPSTVNPLVPGRMDEIVLHALERDPARRFASAREMALELEAATGAAGPAAVAEWVASTSGKRLAALSSKLDTTRRLIRQTQLAAATTAAHGDDTTKLAGVSAVTEDEPRRPRLARRTLGLAVGGALALVALALSLALHERGPESPRTPPVTSQAMGATHEDGPAQPERRPLVEVLPPGEATPSAPTEAVATDEPPQRAPARVGALAGKPRSSGGPRLTKARGKKAAAPNCNPPTYLDADGVRIYKDECL